MMPVHIQYFRFLPHRLTTRSIVFGGVLCTPGKVGLDGLDLLLPTYKQNTRTRSGFTEIRNVSPIGGMEPVLIRQGFLHEDHLNYLISLNYPPEALFQNIGSRTRKHIRYGLKQNTVVIQEVRDELANLMNITGLASLCPEGGGALVNFGHNICIHSPLRLKLSKVGYQIMRKFM